MFTEDTICAISTPPGMGGIGIVRLSGPKAVGIASHIFQSRNSKVGQKFKSHRIYYGEVVNPDTLETVDEALLSVMLAPKTYTREDIAEINCHGGPAAVRKTLALAIAAGARLAEPGEFTKRAFMNGRIDLTQAEAVMDVIASSTELSLSAAVSQLIGGLKGKIEAVKDKLTELLALTEVSIDFPEEEVDYIPVDALRAMGVETRVMVRSLLDTFEEGRVLREGLKVAIVGAPNVGKSSLLNLLARAERAIVTEIPGTTRDTVEELINLGGVPVRVIDTAGIRHSHDIVEREGMRRSEEALKASDLALLVLDGSRALTEEDKAIIEKVNKVRHIVVMNKADLPQALDDSPLNAPLRDNVHVRLSAKTGAGLDDLIALIKQNIMAGCADRVPEAMINLRHRGCLERTDAALLRFDQGSADGLSQEFLAVELKDALDAVGEIVGATTPEDVLDMIFSQFCIGK